MSTISEKLAFTWLQLPALINALNERLAPRGRKELGLGDKLYYDALRTVAPLNVEPSPRAWVGASIAVLVPCYNEEPTIGKVVEDARNALPTATIYVYDNNSTDRTAEVARAAGAVVRHEPRKGKGNVVRRMFADVDADLYVLLDGDATYDAAAAPRIVARAIAENLDFVNGARLSVADQAYPRGHRFGNFVLTAIVRNIFGRQFTDMLSGYKVLSRRFVKSFPAMSRGFEIETELTVHALELRMPCGEELTTYGKRPAGSVSKLNTFRDGAKIVTLIGLLIKNERPLQFFGLLGALLIAIGFSVAIPIAMTYLDVGLVPRLPTTTLVVGMVVVGVLCIFVGLILDMVTTMRHEAKRLAYLAMPGPGNDVESLGTSRSSQ